LSDKDARALVFVRETGAITNAAYRAVNHVDVLAASQHLRRLRDRGLLQQKGKGAETYYVPTEKLLGPWQNRNSPPGQAEQSGNLERQSGNPEPKSGNLPPQSGNPAPGLAFPPGLPADLQEALTRLKSKVPQPQMEDLVWRLCAWRAFSTESLAEMLRRTRKYVQDRLVTPMLRNGRLRMTIPEQPNHPQQQYEAGVVSESDS
jgi:ATP-dependent DNA helicase RecG